MAQLGLEDMQSNIANFCNVVKRITEPENWNKTVGQLLVSEESEKSEEKLETNNQVPSDRLRAQCGWRVDTKGDKLTIDELCFYFGAGGISGMRDKADNVEFQI